MQKHCYAVAAGTSRKKNTQSLGVGHPTTKGYTLFFHRAFAGVSQWSAKHLQKF